MPCNRGLEIDLAELAVDPRAAAFAEFRDHYPRCPECSREVDRFATLKLALATSVGAAVSGHPSEGQLFALATGTAQVAPDERARLEAHLAGCAPCRTELAVTRGFDFAALSTDPRRARWLEWLGAALTPPLRRPALVAALVVVLAVPAAVLVWRRAQETRAIPGPPTAEAGRGAPAADVAKVAPEAPAAADLPPPVAVAETPPQAQPEPSPATPEESPGPPAAAAGPEPTPLAKEAPVAKQPAVAKQGPTAKPPEEREAPQTRPAEPPPRPLEIAALLPSESPLYAPGILASAPSVRIGGAARSLAAGAPTPEALGPAHVGVSAHESPSLSWFLPEATSSPVEVTVVDPGVVAPLLETTLPGPLAAGVHRVSLAEHGVRLKPGVDYRWFVALVRDPERRSQDVVSGAAIRYTPLAPELRARLSAAPPARAAHVYAESGLWYDAFDQLSVWLAAERGAVLLREHRAALLDQVGLGDAAAFERRSEPGDR